jgi:CPA2 family monovalent cation:H+ antiporter-2
MEFSLKKLAQTKRWILIGGGLQLLLTVGVVMSLAMILGVGMVPAIFIGFLFTMSSTAIVMHILQEKGWIDYEEGQAALSVLIFQDVAIIPLMLMVPFLAGDGGDLWSATLKLGGGVLIVGLVIIFARKVVPRLIAQIVHTGNQELFLMAILVICFATAFITYELGLKLALGAFLAGLIISESEYSFDALKNILPLKKLFTSIFFISIGMLLNTQVLMGSLGLVIAIVFGVILLKALLVTVIGISLRLPLREALIVGLTLSQVGEFAFILSEVGIEYAILSQELYQIFLAVSVLSMAVSPFLIVASPHLADRIARFPVLKTFMKRIHIPALGDPHPTCADKNHLLIIGFGPGGQSIAESARKKKICYSIIELNDNTVDHFKELGEPIYSGSATDEEVLLRAAADKAQTIVITVPEAATAELITKKVRTVNPAAHIIVRTQYESEVEFLHELGANEVIPAERAAAQQIADSVVLQFQ